MWYVERQLVEGTDDFIESTDERVDGSLIIKGNTPGVMSGYLNQKLQQINRWSRRDYPSRRRDDADEEEGCWLMKASDD
jgi:hypothetical protein